jgi:isoleucyl-tRNA synthetase
VTPAPAGLTAFGDILRDELNVKAVDFVEFADSSLETYGITRRLSVNARAAGPRIGKQVQAVIQAARAGDWESVGEGVVVGGVELVPGEFELELHAASESTAIAFLSGGGFVLLDTETTPELEAEGLARDVIRSIQDTRKAADFQVSDRIMLEIRGDSDADVSALSRFNDTIGTETLSVATTISFAEDPATDAAMNTGAGSQRTTLAAGQYSNEGVLVIDVRKSGAVDV